MTRINANIDPADLIDQHLLAEYRELVRIPNAVLKKQLAVEKIDVKKLPNSFRLGSGHVLFFYDKLQFLHKRFLALKAELDKRGMQNNMGDEMFLNIYPEYYQDINKENLLEANALVAQRIMDNIATMKRPPTLNRVPVDKSAYQEMLFSRYRLHEL